MPDTIDCHEYVNADAIAAALSPFRPAEVSIEAGRLMLRRIHELARVRTDFAFETTMASRSFLPFLRQCRKDGYRIHCVYVWLRSPALALARVADRVRSGGHFVPDDTVRARYSRGLRNFFALYAPVAHEWAFYDNSAADLLPVAHCGRDRKTHIHQPDVWSIAKGGQDEPAEED
jgi:predicted ABC-type ATPase